MTTTQRMDTYLRAADRIEGAIEHLLQAEATMTPIEKSLVLGLAVARLYTGLEDEQRARALREPSL